MENTTSGSTVGIKKYNVKYQWSTMLFLFFSRGTTISNAQNAIGDNLLHDCPTEVEKWQYWDGEWKEAGWIHPIDINCVDISKLKCRALGFFLLALLGLALTLYYKRVLQPKEENVFKLQSRII